ncbi:MAG: hypothetical protein ABI277_15415 [Burkholderiaceae bacterium]
MDIRTIADIVLAVLLLEAAVLAVAGRRITRLPRFRVLLPTLAAGLFLVLALRSAVAGERAEVVALFLALGGVAHVVDLACRRR